MGFFLLYLNLGLRLGAVKTVRVIVLFPYRYQTRALASEGRQRGLHI